MLALAVLLLSYIAMPAFSDTIDSSTIVDTAKTNTVASPEKFFLDELWKWLLRNLGPIGYSSLGLLAIISSWLVFKLPGSRLPLRWIYCLTHRIPKGDPKKFTVAISELDRDEDNQLQQNLIDGLNDLPFKDSLEILAIPRVVTSRKSNESSRQNAERKLAIRYLKKAKADILVWGIALGEDYDKAKLSWQVSSGHGMSKRYQLGELLELPELFIGDLKDALISVVLTQFSDIDNEESTGKFIADQLEQVVDKLKQLVNKFESSKNELPTELLFVLGNALSTIGEQQGKNSALERAIDLFRKLLKVTAQKQAPLDWAMTQNNLGNALATMGERESGIQRLDEAVRAYQEALKERTRERVPLDWAMTQNNLGNALAIMGERESGTQKLDEAVRAFQEALKERTRQRVPLNWATTQNNLGNALASLGERESGTKRLEEAAKAYENALTVFTPEESSYYWSLTKENLERVLKLIEERKEGS